MELKFFVRAFLLIVWFSGSDTSEVEIGNQCAENPCYEYYHLECAKTDSSFLYTLDSSSRNASIVEYRIIIGVCPQNTLQLAFNETLLDLQTNDSISVGTGNTVDLNELIAFQGDQDLSEESYIYDFHTNQIWIKLIIPNDTPARFEVKMSPLKPTSALPKIYENNSANISSDNYPNPYPPDCDTLYLVNVSAPYNYDLKFTVYDLDIDGSVGDYLFIGPGLDPSEAPSALLSWTENSTFSFVIKGNQAFINFRSYGQGNHAGFYIGYELMVQNVTTTPMPTTTTTGRPTAKPIDPSQLSVEIVAIDKPYDWWTEGGQMYDLQQAIAEICDCYANTTNIDLQYAITPTDVEYSKPGRCYGGWAVNYDQCLYSTVMVIAFTTTGEFAFPKEVLSAAIDDDFCKDPVETKHGFRILLVKYLTNVYQIASWVGLMVVFLCAVCFVFIWRTKYRFYWADQRHIYDAKLAIQAAEGPTRKSSSASSWGGRSNPVFQLDDEDDAEQKNYLEYDPEFGTVYNTSNFVNLTSGYQLPRINMYSRNSVDSNVTSQFDNSEDAEDTLYDREAPTLFLRRANMMTLPLSEPKQSVTSSNDERHIYDFPEDLIEQAENHFGETHF